MVDYSGMFRADPRIKRRRRFADTFTQGSLKPIAPPPGTNVYGFSPWGEAGNRLANILGAQMLESSAERREQEQMAARGQVLAQLLKVGSARPDQLIETQMQEPGPGAMMRTQYSIGNDGAQIPTLDPAIMKTAGLDPAMYQTALAAAKAQGDKLTQAMLERDINRELSSVLSQENPNMALAAQLNALVRPKDELADIRKKAAAAKSASSKDKSTALHRDVEFIAKQMGISTREATELRVLSRRDSPDKFKKRIFNTMLARGFGDAEKAMAETEEIMKMFYPPSTPEIEKVEESDAKKEEGESLVDKITGGLGAVVDALSGEEENQEGMVIELPDMAAALPKLTSGKVDRGKLVVGRLYLTKRGSLKWNGNKFVGVKE